MSVQKCRRRRFIGWTHLSAAPGISASSRDHRLGDRQNRIFIFPEGCGGGYILLIRVCSPARAETVKEIAIHVNILLLGYLPGSVTK